MHQNWCNVSSVSKNRNTARRKNQIIGECKGKCHITTKCLVCFVVHLCVWLFFFLLLCQMVCQRVCRNEKGNRRETHEKRSNKRIGLRVPFVCVVYVHHLNEPKRKNTKNWMKQQQKWFFALRNTCILCVCVFICFLFVLVAFFFVLFI